MMPDKTPALTAKPLSLNKKIDHLFSLDKTALEYIQLKVMNMAKERILDINKSVSEVANELGFKYPQHFTRAFKKSTGVTPNEYRSLN